jgi:hypothetical protein
MKISKNIRTAALAIMTIVMTAAIADAQRVNIPTQTQSTPVQTAQTFSANARPGAELGVQQVQTIELAAMKDRVIANIATATASINSASTLSVEDLVQKGTLRVTADAGSTGPVTEQHLLNVTVHYDARPVGGILTIRADLVPAFSGIGCACRPTVSKVFSQAVDNLDDETIAATIKLLTAQVGQQYAAR